MKIAITGSNGFIGKKLSKTFEEKDIELIKIRRQKDENGVLTSKFILDSNGVSYLKNVDIVIHCAARVHRIKEDKFKAAKLYEESNIKSTIDLANISAKFGVRKFIFLSSIKVNGEETKKDEFFNEESLENPSGIYAKSKYSAERDLMLIKKKLKFIIIRPPLVYGPGVGANFRKILWAVSKELPLPFNEKINKRSFIYIDNLIAFIYECCIKKEADNKIFTVSDNQDLSTKELIEKLAFYMNKNTRLFQLNKFILKYIFKFARKEDTFKKLFNSLQINPKNGFKKLQFSPPYSVDYGLKETVNWYINLNNINNE